MRKILLLVTVISAVFLSLYSQDGIDWSANNKFAFIMRDMEGSEVYTDDYKNYFSNEFTLQLTYKNWMAGLEFDIYLPDYQKYLRIEQAGDEDDEYIFNEYYLQYSQDEITLRAGTYSAVIGTGMVMHCFYDDEFEKDTSLKGFYGRYNHEKIKIQLFSGLMENQTDKDEFDQLAAIDAELRINDYQIATGYVLDRTNLLKDDEYAERNIIFTRMGAGFDKMDFKAETAFSDADNEEGRAFYSVLTGYLGAFTLSASYKNYFHFNKAISDLPSVNHADEGFDYPGKDEEGLMGEISFLPTDEDEIIVNYSEGWADTDAMNISDLYLEYKKEKESYILKCEFEQVEKLHDFDKKWEKETTPATSIDFTLAGIASVIKAEYQIIEHDNKSEYLKHFEPKLQTDFSYGKFSVSAIIEHEFGDFENNQVKDFGDSDSFWIGAELATSILWNSDVRLFAGKEKAGKVCRNGVCKQQPEFSGVRLEITTNF